MYKILFFLLVSVLLQAAVYDGVAIVVKNRAITLLDIKNEMKNAHIDAKKAVNILIRQKLEELEIQERKISVSSGEVYDYIKQMASHNHLSISAFYDAVRNSNGLSSMEFKKKIKQKLLSQKLYQAITYSSLSEPSEEEVSEYFDLHKDNFKHPVSFTVMIYATKERNLLQKKVNNPMFYSSKIQTDEQVLPYTKISPELAQLLEKTAVNSFTPIIPNGKGGFMSFYIKEVTLAKNSELESVHTQIVNLIMEGQREEILSDYFAKLKNSADINIIREVK